MGEKIDPAEMRMASELQAAIPDLVARAARDARLVSAGRGELRKLLAAQDLRKLADSDTELGRQLVQVTAAITEDEKAAAAWQKDLSEASKQWEAGLAALSKLHSDEV